MIVHWPGRKGEVIEYRTEHFDIAPTIVGQALGCDATPPRVYATGNGLFQRPDRNWSIAHSYMARSPSRLTVTRSFSAPQVALRP